MKLFFSFTFILFSFLSFSQLSISKKFTPNGIVNQVLKGKGVEIANVSYRGASNALATFTANNTNIGIKEGIILSTGSVFNAIGPNIQEGKTTIFDIPGYNLLGPTSMDAAVLEFDFTPQGDTIEFQYVFASEEYPEYVNKEFNDIFGFFISGPGISGVRNIAILPDGNTVAINNVNQFKNSNFYISNEFGKTIEYDGFTKVLTARAIVQCGKTYHLILAIADIQDLKYDSAIFLSAKSLSVPTKFEVKQTLSNYFFDDDSTKMLENCTSANIKISRAAQFLNRSSTLNISIEGSAVVDKDYSNTIPKTINFTSGELSKDISFKALYDKEKDTLDSLILIISGPEICEPIRVKFTFQSIEPLDVELLDDTLHCENQPIFLKPKINGGLSPYNYVWSTGSFQDSIQVLPNQSTNYSVTVNDKCFNLPITVTNTVIIPTYVQLAVNLIPDFTEICPYKPTYIPVKPVFGGGAYTFKWYKNNVLFSDVKIDTLKPEKTAVYKVLVSDRCGDTISTNFKYTITSPPLISSISGDSVICFQDSSLLKINASGGYGKYFYRWENLNSTNDSVFAKNSTSSWFIANISDECKTFEIQDSFYVRVMRPIVDFEIKGNPIINSPIDLINKSQNVSNYKWFVDNEYVSNDINTTVILADSANHAFRLLVTDEFGCKGDTTIFFLVYYTPTVYIPNAFTPDNNLFNNVFQPVLTSIKTIDFSIYNRWGEKVFHTNELRKCYWDGTYNGDICPNGVYIYKLKTTSVTNESKEFVGHVNLIK